MDELIYVLMIFFSVKALNQARLEASVRAYGGGGGAEKISNKFPSPYVLVCGALLVVSLFEHFWPPLKWFALAGAAAGLPPIVLRSVAAARRLTLDVNILMLIAGTVPSDGLMICWLPLTVMFHVIRWLSTRTQHVFHVIGLAFFFREKYIALDSQ